MTKERLDAVWAAVYVHALTASPWPQDINSTAKAVAEPDACRVKTAIAAADNAVLRLVEVTANG